MARIGIDRLRHIWHNIKYRCYNPNCSLYEHYGARGIKMSDEWKDSFEQFYNWAINNGYSDNLSIDRIDNDGDYCAENCQWLTTADNTAKSNCTTRRRYPDNKQKYFGISPDGVEYIFDNAAQFEREHNISRGFIGRCVHNERGGWKGWTFRYI